MMEAETIEGDVDERRRLWIHCFPCSFLHGPEREEGVDGDLRRIFLRSEKAGIDVQELVAVALDVDAHGGVCFTYGEGDDSSSVGDGNGWSVCRSAIYGARE